MPVHIQMTKMAASTTSTPIPAWRASRTGPPPSPPPLPSPPPRPRSRSRRWLKSRQSSCSSGGPSWAPGRRGPSALLAEPCSLQCDWIMAMATWRSEGIENVAAFRVAHFQGVMAQLDAAIRFRSFVRARGCLLRPLCILPDCPLCNACAQQVYAVARARTQPDRVDPTTGIALDAGRALEAVHLVAYAQKRHVAGADLLQHLLDLACLFRARRARRVDYVQQQVGVRGLVQRGAEGLDQRVRQ